MFVNRDDKGKRKGRLGWVAVLHAVSTCGDRRASLTFFIISPNHLTTYYAAKVVHHSSLLEDASSFQEIYDS